MRFLAMLSALAAVASALPFEGLQPASLESRACTNLGRFISIVIDASGSNKDTDPNNLRLSGSKEIVQYLDPSLDRVSIVKFSTFATLAYPMGAPSGAIRPINSINALGSTNVARGLELGLRTLGDTGSQNQGRTGLVMFTDGLETDKNSMLRALATAKAQGVRVSWGHLVSVGNGVSKPKGLLSLLLGWSSGGNPGSPNIDPDISAAVLLTGGTVAVITNPEAQLKFVDQILKYGLTSNDGDCGGVPDEEGGGPINPDIITNGLCSNNAKAVYTYKPKGTSAEELTFSVALVSKTNPVNLQCVFTNVATGQTKTMVVNKDSLAGTIVAQVGATEEVSLTITPSGALETETCQFSVGLVATVIVNPTTNPPTTNPPTTSPPTINPPTTTTSTTTPSSSKPATTSPTTPPGGSNTSSSSSSKPPATSTTTPPGGGNSSSSSSSKPPTTSTTSPPGGGSTSSTPGVPTGATSCAASNAATVVSTVIQTFVQTVTSTVTGAGGAEVPSATASVCMCACSVAGAKPFPKFEL